MTTIPLHVILSFLALHTFADFWMQTHWMATNKSSSVEALLMHVLMYALVGLVPMSFVLWLVPPYGRSSGICAWLMFNVVAHFVTDFVTSRASSKEFGTNWHNFFVVVGTDQYVHFACLFGSLYFIPTL